MWRLGVSEGGRSALFVLAEPRGFASAAFSRGALRFDETGLNFLIHQNRVVLLVISLVNAKKQDRHSR